MKSKKTRERILDASLELFNRKKASNVSTVQISAEMKISPGNLYYYYSNKEDVIRCIWDEHMKGDLEALLESTKKIESAAELLDFIGECLKYMIKYRFFYTELSTLFVNDESLVDIYRESERNVQNTFSALGDKFCSNGYVIPDSHPARKVAVQNATAAAEHMLQRYEVYRSNGISKEEFIAFSWISIVAALEPIFEDKMKNEIKAELTARGFSNEKYMTI